jgi:uncharacterized protein (DUF3084 family)
LKVLVSEERSIFTMSKQNRYNFILKQLEVLEEEHKALLTAADGHQKALADAEGLAERERVEKETALVQLEQTRSQLRDEIAAKAEALAERDTAIKMLETARASLQEVLEQLTDMVKQEEQADTWFVDLQHK